MPKDDKPEDDIEIVGTAKLKISASVSTDTWSDYEQKWSSSERLRFDIHSASHFGWCIGLHVVYLAEALVKDRTSNTCEAMRGLAAALREKSQEILEELEKASDE